MGLIADIVPNHMGIESPENTWWWDVLAHGKDSPFAAHFDIDWKPADESLRDKVLLPVLGAEYETVLLHGELQVAKEQGKHVLRYYDQRFPVAAKTAGRLPANGMALQAFNADRAALDELIQQQHYQLAFYEVGDARLNYRRFFAVSTLAAVCVEAEATFAATHELLRRWLEQGRLDGLRVDHPDGLRDPQTYLQRLRTLAPQAWIVVEKILETGETLPPWPVQGTTGYDFLNAVNGIYVDTGAEQPLTDLYVSFTGRPANYTAMLLEKKRDVLKTLLVAELNRLTGLLAALAPRSGPDREFSHTELREALVEVVACFPVYRSYLAAGAEPDADDVAAIKAAVHLACEHRPDLPAEVFAFIHAAFLESPRSADAGNFVARFQQLSGAVMAKGAEDTAFYCFNRFTSLNEVGGDPGRFGVSPADFHRWLRQQAAGWPHSQLTTSTHDTKRAEDVRARLNVLSEIPELWAETVQSWSDLNARHRRGPFPDRNTEYLYYQTLVGAWPLPEARAQAYLEKASHEAKEQTDWTRRNAPFEDALRAFVADTLRSAEFRAEVERLVGRISEAAQVNSVGQTLIKLTAPGVPDIYQGCELWDLSLVDPDNRRPVDFALRRSLLEAAKTLSAEDAWKGRAEGVPKLWLIRRTLQLRAQIADFGGLDYEPLAARGARAEHVIAYARGDQIITVVPRLVLKLNRDWQDTTLALPAGEWHNEFGGEPLRGVVRLDALLAKFPVALLVRKEPGR
jgi:(1->4)-alpha-D-glucan 1-alpha-D-glucosylmutase